MKSFPKQERQLELFKKSLKTRAYVEGDLPITGRSCAKLFNSIISHIPINKLLTYIGQRLLM